MSCAVVGCTKEASETNQVYLPSDATYVVCEPHRDQLEGGDDWMPGQEPGSSSGVAPSGILMGENLPWRVLAVSSSRSGGSRPGLLLKLTMVREGDSRDFELLVPQGEGEVLLSLLVSQSDKI